ncbi:MAG: glucoamylase family protein [Clostridiales bacterium]|nr:glucoamylase family protein [Clostridiales bacterium]
MFVIFFILSYVVLISIIVFLIYKNRICNRISAYNFGFVILNPEQLQKHGRKIAREHHVSKRFHNCSNILPRLKDDYKQIIKTYKELNGDVVNGEPVVPAAEWLFDNFYIIEEQVKDIRANFPKGYNASLPCLTEGILKGFPRVYDIALELVYHIDGLLEEKLIINFIRAYQEESQLTSGELWAFPIMLKIALIEDIRQICDDILKSRDERKKAAKVADAVLIDDNSEKLLDRLKSYIDNMEVLSPAFAEHILQRVRSHGADFGSVMHYFDEKLSSQDTNAEEIIQREHQDQAQKQVSIGNCITGLRLLSNIDWHSIFEVLSPVEQILSGDPADVYRNMDFQSRDYYRHEIEEISRRLKISESQVARKAIECAMSAPENADLRLRHVGYYIAGRGSEKFHSMLDYRPGVLKRTVLFMKRHPLSVYLLPVCLITLAISLLIMWSVLGARESINPYITVIIFASGLILSSEIAVGVVNWTITHIIPPSFLPKLELKSGIPESLSSMVVIPTLLQSRQRVKELLDMLEVYYLGNHENNLYFALLGDFTDAKSKNMPDDESIVNYALDEVKKLNRKYSFGKNDLFYFFHRYREFNKAQGVWMGWERKRGKLMEFNKLLRGADDTSYYVKSGDIKKIPKIKYVITLDADTELPRGTAKRLIGTIFHPLNRAMVDDEGFRVMQGYGILQPRISIGVVNATKSVFSRAFAGQGGIDPYTTAVSDVYQDLFGEGIYTGKGIYDVDVFLKMLDGYIPDNTVLSHDLLEGSYARCGLVTDIELVDGFPSTYSSYTARMHRWIRGDWQLLPWLCFRVKNRRGQRVRNPLSAINKWKIIDNLRRSLIPVSLVIFIILSLCLSESFRKAGIAIAAFTLAFPLISGMADALIANRRESDKSNGVLSDLKNTACQIVLLFIFLPYRAYIMTDAILRTIARLSITHKKLLEWETAADAEKRLKNNMKSYAKRMWISQATAFAMLGLAIRYMPSSTGISVVLATAWLISPFAAYFISKAEDDARDALSDDDISELRLLSRKIWRYFEELADAEDNYLPPDNYQDDPPNGAAHRTSPTNIGLTLMAMMAARDMGYHSTTSMIRKIDRIFSSIDRLDKWNGHLYNWYDTKTLQPLRPLYVSTVDSGNFVGYLMTLKEGLEQYMDIPLCDGSIARGLIDTIKLLNSDIKGRSLDYSYLRDFQERDSLNVIEWKKALESFRKNKQALNKSSYFRKSPYDKKVDEELDELISEIEEAMPWVSFMESMPDFFSCEDIKGDLLNMFDMLNGDISLTGLSRGYRKALSLLNAMIDKVPEECSDVCRWLKELKLALIKAVLFVNRTISNTKNIIQRSNKLIANTEFRQLFDNKKQLFSIGYSAEGEQLNKSYYDLLASESRQTSFIAIAKGDIDQKHWFRLGRSLTYFNGYRGLVSWSGTMFEYLMPLLIMKNYRNTLLDNTYKFAVKSQIAYGKKKNVPWGVSESGFYSFDIGLNYQYKAFGIPRLGLKRGLVNDTVTAPYASLLALMVDPVSAMKNIRFLKSYGLEGQFGPYEAVDYTAERVPVGKKYMVVKSFMVHHHGMSLMALDNAINDNIMQKRFHRDPEVKATELLLQEKVPSKVVLTKDIEDEISPIKKIEKNYEEYVREIKDPVGRFPEAHILSNGTYFTVVTNSGSGFSRAFNMSVTRWREDEILDDSGMFFYIQNINSNDVWSAAYEPYKILPEDYKVLFTMDKIDFFRTDGSIDTHTEIIVSPEDNAEIRKVSLTNHSGHVRVLEVTSYFEVVMSAQSADIAHRVFNNLFVKTEFVSDINALLAVRRPRARGQKEVWLCHTVCCDAETIGSVQYETDRARFIGRGRDLSDPVAMDVDHPLSNTCGAVLDPVMSLRRRVRIKPGETVRLSYMVGVAKTREDAIKLAQKYSDAASAKRAAELAWTRSKLEFGYLNLRCRQIELYRRILSHVIFSSSLRRKIDDIIMKNSKGQSGLWAYGISGDNPVILIAVKSLDELDMVKEALKMHEFFRTKGLISDLVILNEETGNYMQTFNEKLKALIGSGHAAQMQDRPGGVFLRQSSIMPEEALNLLYCVARVVFRGEDGSMWQQLKFWQEKTMLPEIRKSFGAARLYKPYEEENERLQFFNGLGGFTQDGREYVINISDEQNTPAPWSNVICNSRFGFLVTESGGGYTWSENSRENKLTPWSNDPVIDEQGEIVYLEDEETGEIWNITAKPAAEKGKYTVRHGFGYTVFEHASHGIKQHMTVFVPEEDSVKLISIKLKNLTDMPRRISAIFYAKPVLGVTDEITKPFIVTQVDDKTGIFLIRNVYSDDFPGRVAFVDCSESERTVTGDREEFIGREGSLKKPEGLLRERLSGRTGAAYEPCAAMKVTFEIKGNQDKVVVFSIGEGSDIEGAISTALKYRDTYEADKALLRIKGYWNRTLRTIQVKTPDESMNILANGWLLYQTISCRIWARSAFYQSGGAYGFRDQLQDVMAAAYVSPEITKKQILNCCAHQFLEGDVQHWWHPVTDRGIRTRFSDDLLWLPYVTIDYVNVTGDHGILDVQVRYIEDEPLSENEDERYNKPGISSNSGTLYEHCLNAIERSLRFGEHGIPLMGAGDWNDGMNTVGNKGKGESIWLGWFMYKILVDFSGICRKKGDAERADKYVKTAGYIKDSIEKSGWDGSWYRRAYFDDGTPLGSAENAECQIDSLAQSWSVISNAARETRSKEAMKALDHYLIKYDAGIIKLLTPPFDMGNLKPGYIKSYVPGVRENGGQYTHAAVWVILAYALMGDGNKAWELFHMINPINHALTPMECFRYKVEPYVMAADVYAVEPHTGRGGWTWYTGAAGWMYRVCIEHMLGLKIRGGELIIDPCIPSFWNEFSIKYMYMDTLFNINIKNPLSVSNGVSSIKLDDRILHGKSIMLVNDKMEHSVDVTMG